MKKAFSMLVVVLLVSVACFAQGGRQPGKGRERIHAAKMAYIVDRLRLTSDQSAAFTPVYNEYEREKRECKKKFLKNNKSSSPNDVDEATAKQLVEDNLEYQEVIIQIKRKYNDRFLKVISAQQLLDLNQAEREFKQILIQRLKERRDEGGPRGQRGRR